VTDTLWLYDGPAAAAAATAAAVVYDAVLACDQFDGCWC